MSIAWIITLSAALASGETTSRTVVEVLNDEESFVVGAFTLDDQFRETTIYEAPKDVPHIVFIADRHSGYDTVKWYLRFEKEFGDSLDYYGIGALDDIPRIFRPVVRPFLRRQVDKPILLDWDNSVSESLRYEAGMPNVLLVAADGTVLARVVGTMDDAAYDACSELLAPHMEKVDELPPLALRSKSSSEAPTSEAAAKDRDR